MTFQEQLAEAKSALCELKDAIEQGDAEATEKGAELSAKIVELQEQEAKATEAQKIINQIGTIQDKGATMDEIKEPTTIGEMAVKYFSDIECKGQFSIATPEVKTDPTYMTGVTQVQYNHDPKQILANLKIAGLFGHEVISGNSYTFFKITDKNGSVGTTSEGAKKNQIDFTTTAVTVALTKVTGLITVSEELLNDSSWLANGLEARLLNKLGKAEEAQLISGNGSAPNMTGILNTSGIGSVTYAHGGSLSADDIFKAIMKVKNDSNMDADAILINPADYQTLRLAKDSNNQYYGGGYFAGAYGNGTMAQVPALWGVPTYLTTEVTSGTVLVGAFREGASIITKGGLQLVAGNATGDFEADRVTIRAEKREVLAVYCPAAFVSVTEAA